MSYASQELLDLIQDGVLITNERQMIISGKLHKLRAWNSVSNKTSFFNFQALVISSMNHECGHAYRRQHRTHVDLSIHLSQRERATRTRAHAEIRRPPFSKLRIVSFAWRPLLETHRLSPMRSNLFEEVLAMFGSWRPRIVVVANALGISSNHDHGERLLRISRGEQSTEWSSLRDSTQGGSFGSNCIHHRAHIIHALLERRQFVDRHSIRKACAAFIEKD